MNHNFAKTNAHDKTIIISKENRILDSYTHIYNKIKSNILELLFENNNLYSLNKKRIRYYSEPNSKYIRKKIQKKRNLNIHKVCTTKKILKIRKDNENMNNSNKLRLNIKEDEKPFIINDFEKEKNQELKIKEINKNELKNTSSISNENKRCGKDFNEKINNNTDALLNINDKFNSDFININNKYPSNDISTKNNSNQNLNILNYYSNSNTNY